MNIPQKIMDMFSIIILTIQGIVYLIYNKFQETIIRTADATPIATPISPAGDMEHFISNNDSEAPDGNIASYNLYKPDDMIAANSNKYDQYSITNIIPENIVLPSNYKLTTNEFEKENTDYNYKDYSNVDGSGVHLRKGWAELSSINRPWFETCMSEMDCKITTSDSRAPHFFDNLDKIDYQ
jgi:hypothetical protein